MQNPVCRGPGEGEALSETIESEMGGREGAGAA